MKTSHLKLVSFAAILGIVVLGSVYLLAQPPEVTPAASPAAVLTPSVSASPNATAAILPSLSAAISPSIAVALTPAPTPSTQPKITWSTTSIEVILSPGESASKDVTFTSTLDLSNIAIECAPELTPFVSIHPTTFRSVLANEHQSIHMTVTVPSSAPLETYAGSLHLRTGRTTYPDSMEVVVTVWRSYRNVRFGYELSYPDGTIDTLSSGRAITDTDSVALQIAPVALPLRVCASDNAKHTNSAELLKLWTNAVPPTPPESLCGAYRKDVRSIEPVQLGGISGYRACIFAYDHFDVCDYAASPQTLLAICIPYENPADLKSEMHSTTYALIRSTLKFTDRR